MYLEAVVIACCPVPHPAIKTSVFLEKFNFFKSTSKFISLITSFIILGSILKPRLVHLGYGFSSYWDFTFWETSSLIAPSCLIFWDNSISFKGSVICNSISSLKLWLGELKDFKVGIWSRSLYRGK